MIPSKVFPEDKHITQEREIIVIEILSEILQCMIPDRCAFGNDCPNNDTCGADCDRSHEKSLDGMTGFVDLLNVLRFVGQPLTSISCT
jgi:hypothetical protein